MEVYEAITKRRSIRKFKQQNIKREILEKLINAARLAPQGANIQPLKYCIIDEEQLVKEIFNNTKWAGYLYPEYQPKEGETPVAFIGVLCDTNIKEEANVDVGAAGENLILAATGEGLGTCWLGAIKRDEIREILGVPTQYNIHSLVALGYPAEEPKTKDLIDENGSIKYYLDDDGILTVPKRKMEDVTFYNKFS